MIKRAINLLLGALLTTGCNVQERLLYYPDKGVPAEAEIMRSGMRFWPSGPGGYRGFVSVLPEGRAKGTVIVFHGNAATAADRTYYLDPLSGLGYRVLLAEYPEYGGRPGKLGEESFAADARETVRLAAKEYGAPLFLLGESLGAAVAASALRGGALPVDGMILVTPWGNLERVAREKFPWLPVRLLMTDWYDTAASMALFMGPVAVLSAGRDTVIPPRHARELYESLSGTRKWWSIAGADHNDWPDYINGATWQEVMEFVAADTHKRH